MYLMKTNILCSVLNDILGGWFVPDFVIPSVFCNAHELAAAAFLSVCLVAPW